MMIDAQKLIDKLVELEDDISGEECDYYHKGMMLACRKVRRWIDIMAVDDEPVVHSCWWLEREPDGTPYCFHCLNCDSGGSIIGNNAMKRFCPDCGAKMDEHGYMDGGDYHEVD